MKSLIVILSTTFGGWIGWWLGYQLGIFTALVLSMLGSGLGIYAGRRINQMYN